MLKLANHRKMHGAGPGCRDDGLRRLHLDIAKDGKKESRDSELAQPRRTGTHTLSNTNANAPIFSVPGHGSMLLRNTLGKRTEAGNTEDYRQGGPSSPGQRPTTCFKVTYASGRAFE